MASSYTPRLKLPEMASGEQSGYVTFNELGQVLDAVVQTVIQSRTVTAPPGSPADGQIWYVPTGATGAWTGHEGQLAQWYNGAWYYYVFFIGAAAWVIDEEFMWVIDAPAIHATMALAGAAVPITITTTATAFDIADSSLVAQDAPNPTSVDLANSRFTINDYLTDYPVSIDAMAAIVGSGNNVQYALLIYKNGVLVPYLRCAATVTNQSPNAILSIPGGITEVKAGDTLEARLVVSSGSQSSSVEAFSFSVMPIK